MGSNQMRLKGTSNWVEWHRSFKKAAKRKDVWDLLTGESSRLPANQT